MTLKNKSLSKKSNSGLGKQRPKAKQKKSGVGTKASKQSQHAQGTLSNMPNAKVRKRKASENKPPAGRRKRRKSSSDIDRSNREVKVSDRAYTKWILLPSKVLDFLTRTMDANISAVLGDISSREFEDIQNHLNTLRYRLTDKLRTLKVPATNLGDYGQLHTNIAWLESMLEKNTDKVESLNEEIDQQERLNHKMEREIDKLNEIISGEPDEELHPLLEADDPELCIPSVPDLQSTSTEVLQTRCPSAENHMGQFMACLAKVADAL